MPAGPGNVPDMEPIQGPRRPEEVYAGVGGDTTLAALDAACGFATRVEGDLDPLWSRWFEAISKVPLKNLADDDVARVLDSGLHLPVVLPLALGRLRDPSREEVPDRLMMAVARASRRVRPRLAPLAEESREALRSCLERGEQWQEVAQAALSELERKVPLEQAWGWREPPSPMAPRPPLEEFRARSGEVRSPYPPGEG